MWMGLIQSVKDLNRTKDWSTPVRENSACRWSLDLHCNIVFSVSPQLDGLGTWTAAAAPLWVSSLPAHPADLGLGSPHNHVSQFLKTYRWLIGNMKRCSVSPIIKKMQIETTMIPPQTCLSGNYQKARNKCWWGCGENRVLVHCWWECK